MLQRSIPHQLGRLFLIALFAFGPALPPSSAVAQSGAANEFGADTLDYYLYQAFSAARAEQRIALNHIGVEALGVKGGYLVTAALEGYPAHLAGIERGDKLVRVDGEAFHPVHSFNPAADEAGQFVAASHAYRLEFERQGGVEAVDIVPVFENLYDSYRTALITSAQAFPLGNKTIGYVRFWGLSRGTSDLFALDLLMRDFGDSDGMILDLRNTYGYLSREHLDRFTRDGRGDFETSDASNRHASLGPGIPSSTRPFTKPVVVLINSQTRGGAELLAHGLSKLERISTLGERTAGRIGAYSQAGGVMRYMPAETTLIDGAAFENAGVLPELPVAFPFTQSSRSDPQFEAAVDYLLGRI